MDKTIPGILLVTFGVSTERGGQVLVSFAKNVRSAFPGHAVRWAFTSRDAKRRPALDGLPGMTLPEALACFGGENRSRILVQPLHLTDGHEHAAVRAQVAAWRETRPETAVALGSPLLTDAASARALLGAMQSVAPPGPEEAAVWVAHGSGGPSPCSSGLPVPSPLPEGLRLCITFGGRAAPPVHIGTLAAGPDAVIDALWAEGKTRARLLPLFVLAGRHVSHDLNGTHPGSWRSSLESAGIACRTELSGMLENGVFTAMWLERLREAGARLP